MSADVFPRYLAHSGGQQMELDESKLLLSFVDPPDVTDLRDRLAQLAMFLEGEDEADRGLDERLRPGRVSVNHTLHQFWVSAATGDQLRPQELYRAFDKSLDWVAPVYRLGEPGPLQELICPQPDVLLITLSDHWEAVQQDGELPPALRQVDMTELPECSRYHLRGRYFRLTRPRETPAYEVRRELLAAESRFIEDVDLAYMPLRLPYSFEPTDPLYPVDPVLQAGGQWNMRRIKAGGTGTTGWDFSTGDPGIVVAVMDCGCERGHPDLQPNMQVGARLDDMESPGDTTTLPNFVPGHGTSVAGIIAAQMNNGRGVAGLAGGVAGVQPGGCQIMPLAFVTSGDDEVERGILYAADHGARVLSMSFNSGKGGYDTPRIRAAIEYAFNKNMVICASTGNQNIGQIMPPANLPHVIACGGSDADDERFDLSTPTHIDGSNYGDELSVVAPALGIWTTQINKSYRNDFGGTSAAAPHVAGLAALILSINRYLSNARVRQIIEDTADKVGKKDPYLVLPFTSGPTGPYRYWSRQRGFGRINVARALASVPPPLVGPFKPKSLKSEVKEIEYPIPPIPPKPLEAPNGVWPGVDLLALYQNLMQRVDQLEERVPGRSFIRAEDRPEMGLSAEGPDKEPDVRQPDAAARPADIEGGAAGPETH